MTQESATLKQMEPVLLNVNELGFIERGTGKHQSNTVYATDGICPCECSTQHKEPFKILEESSGS
jgi:hypothetical protein